LNPSAVEKSVRADEEGIDPLGSKFEIEKAPYPGGIA